MVYRSHNITPFFASLSNMDRDQLRCWPVLLPSMKSMKFLTLVLFLLSTSFSVGQTVLIQNVPPEALRLARDASAAEARSDWLAAEQNYLKAIKLAPTWAEVLVNLAAVYNRQARSDKAIEALKQAAVIKP